MELDIYMKEILHTCGTSKNKMKLFKKFSKRCTEKEVLKESLLLGEQKEPYFSNNF